MGRSVLETPRLLLRPWREQDRDGFAALNADPVVMEHFPAPLARERSDVVFDLIAAQFDRVGYGIWAVEERASTRLIGLTGLAPVGFLAPFTPAVEIGWRLFPHAWGHGHATEAAGAALEFGFTRGGLEEIVAFTSPNNVRSLAVMRRLGMSHDGAEDFDHPRVPSGHRLRRHVLHRITASRWQASHTRAGSPPDPPRPPVGGPAGPLSPESVPRR